MSRPIAFHFRMRGLEDIEDRLAAIRGAGELVQKLASMTYQDASKIMSVSQRLVPVRFGNLKATGHVQVPVIHGDVVTCFFGYGGPSAPYAVVVHENLRARHKNGVAKYLEIPYLEYVKGSLQAWKEQLTAASVFGRGVRRIGRAM